MLKLYKGLKPFKWLLSFAIIFIIAKSMADLYVPELLRDVTNLIPMNPAASAPVAEMIFAGSIALLAVLGVVIAEIIISYLSSKIAFGFGKNLRKRIFVKVQSLGEVELEEIGTSSLITRTLNDVNQLQMVTMMIIRMMFGAPVMLIGGAIMAFNIDADMTLVILGALPIIILLVAFVGLKIVPIYKNMQKKLDKLTLVSKENITGVRVIRAFNTEKLEQERFDVENKSVTSLATTANRYMAITMPTVSLIFSLVTLLIIWFGATGASQFADINAIMQYSMRIMISFIMLIMMFILVPRASASASRINEVLALEPNIKNPIKTMKPKKTNIYGKIEFKDVSFKFTDAENYAIEHISFTSLPGEITAIIGGTGSGKSTITNLIPRFYEVSTGKILIDDVNIKNYNLNELRNKMAIIPQKATLFNMSIKDNIKYGNENATMKTIKKAAKISQSENFILEEKGGYDYMIDKGGANLSGGQKQRLSIARAIVKNPEIYIFDDSFSALDLKTDSKLRKELAKETTTSTVLIVAQKISTIREANQIIVLDNGSVVGIGTHKKLLKNCKAYIEIYNSQNKEVK